MFLQKPMLGAQLDHSDSLNNPVLDLLFNEGHGDIVHDLSGGGNHGTLHGFDFPPTVTSGWNPGADGVCLAFDGVDDYIDCGNKMPDFRNGFIFDVLFKNAAAAVADGSNHCVMSARDYNDYALHGVWGGHIEFLNNNGSVVLDGGIAPTDRYVRATVTYDLGFTTYYLYIDGILKASQVETNTVVNSTLSIGRDGSGGNSFRGSIARARILPRAMSAFEAMQRQIDPYGVYLR